MESNNKLSQIEHKKLKAKSDKSSGKSMNSTSSSNNDMLVFEVDKLNQFK